MPVYHLGIMVASICQCGGVSLVLPWCFEVYFHSLYSINPIHSIITKALLTQQVIHYHIPYLPFHQPGLSVKYVSCQTVCQHLLVHMLALIKSLAECPVCLLSDGVSALTCSHAGSQFTQIIKPNLQSLSNYKCYILNHIHKSSKPPIKAKPYKTLTHRQILQISTTIYQINFPYLQ